MKKIISVLLAVVLAFSCVIIVCAEDSIDWSEIIGAGTQRPQGDVNNDGKVSAVDALYVLKYVAGTQDLDSTQKQYADANGDKTISGVDARKILKIAAKKQ